MIKLKVKNYLAMEFDGKVLKEIFYIYFFLPKYSPYCCCGTTASSSIKVANPSVWDVFITFT